MLEHKLPTYRYQNLDGNSNALAGIGTINSLRSVTGKYSTSILLEIFIATRALTKAIKECYTQTRKFVMARWGLTEMEATSVITQGILDFAMTQLVDVSTIVVVPVTEFWK